MPGDEWLRRHEVAALWGVSHSTVAPLAERYKVRTQKLATEQRYLAADVERAYREMTGEAD